MQSTQQVWKVRSASAARFEYAGQAGIAAAAATPPLAIPRGHVGPFVIPGTGRTVWWTGRVAIGLRHQPEAGSRVTQSSLWVQRLMLDAPRQASAG